MTRRSSGEGTVRQRANGAWEARYYDASWNRRSIYASTKEEAVQSLREALHGRDRGLVPPTGRETVAEYLITWLAGTQLSIRPTTYDVYERTVRLYLIPGMGRVRLSRLQPPQIRQLYLDLLERGLSPKTVRNAAGVLHAALEQAVKDRTLAVNAAHAAGRPKASAPEMRTYSPDQVQRLFEAARGDSLEALYVLAITAGLRQGELLALRWQDVDLVGARLSVTATLEQRRRYPARLTPPKTPRSRRQVLLSAAALEALGRRRGAQKVAVLPTAYVFARPDGSPMSGNYVYKRWRRLAQLAQVPVLRFHDLRHTAASLMLGRGVHPKLVSEMLGHASIGITLDRYSHTTPAMHREAVRVMDELFNQFQ
jgi:integrase